ncbi:MAG: DUF3343 domain-containing protein [Deltaproteobacteria bacterium]|nr:DUF3343 domain-containing protein [Deltaproteobacteria bacterium]
MTEAATMELRLLFHSIHNVMLAEELLLANDIPTDMLPVPRELSSDCGMCLAGYWRDLARIKACFANQPFTSPILIYRFMRRKATVGPECELLLTIP